jgi:hypothetical protein
MRLRRAAIVVPLVLAFVGAMGGVASAKTVSGSYASTKCIKLYSVNGAVPTLSWSDDATMTNNTLTLSNVSFRADAGGDCTDHGNQTYAPRITITAKITLIGVSFGSCSTSFDISWPPGVDLSCSNGGTTKATFTASLPCHTPPGNTHGGITHCTNAANLATYTLGQGKLVGFTETASGEYYNAAGDGYHLEPPS